MTELTQNAEPLSLWDCLHDGSIISFKSDFMARTLTIVVDSAYHWSFHKLAADTRFLIVGENVRIAEAFDFEPWPGAVEPDRSTPWAEAQEQQQLDYEKGRLISSDWNTLVQDLKTAEDYVILNATLSTDRSVAILELGVMSYPNSNYRTVRIHAHRFRYLVGERELSLEQFEEFGEAYWEARRSKAKLQEKESV